ncbi:MAG: hypothetical protein KC657_09230 [Myxococcales bacterium]|nr:hypothetical protein [Myxococcales bacterium]
MAKRARTIRREAERATDKLRQARMKLAALEPGGSPARPIELVSASVIEPHAASMPCAACGGTVRVDTHEARTFGAGDAPKRVRVVHVRCVACGTERDVYFSLDAALPS